VASHTHQTFYRRIPSQNIRSPEEETAEEGDGAKSGSLTLGGSTYQFSTTIGSVTDLVKTTGLLEVGAFGSNVTLSGSENVPKSGCAPTTDDQLYALQRQ
jgi:hypothetical protein